MLCHNCNEGTHTTCLDAPLAAVPQGIWLCHQYNQDTESSANEVNDLTVPRLDITRDLPSLQNPKDSTFPLQASEQEKVRIRNKSKQLFLCYSDKAVPDTNNYNVLVRTVWLRMARSDL